MSIHIPFQAERLLLGLEAASPEVVIRSLVRAVLLASDLPSGLQPEALVQAALEEARYEVFGPDALAIAVRLPGLNGVRLSFATLDHAIEFPQVSCKIRWVVLLLSPRERPVQEVRIIEQLALIAKDEASHYWVDAARDPHSLAPWLDQRLREDDGVINARDLMRPSFGRIHPDMPIPELVSRMSRHGLEAVGVSDENRQLVGVITVSDLFTLGMPDFFKQLKSVSFIPDFDPFERYFAEEGRLTAKDVMSTNFCTMPPEATILEVVFALAVQGHPKVFVVESGRLIGVIDRIRVLDQILRP